MVLRTTLLTAAALAGALNCSSVQAAQATLEEVIVTAERREASIQDVPIAVTALSMEQLENRQITQPENLMFMVPSLKMLNNITSPTNLSPSMRGSLQQDASVVVADSPFGIYVDDVFVPRLNGNNIALSDIERVEVLRGPQGTLYGRNTLQGAIKFISRTPGDDPWFNASVGVGNYDQAKVDFSVGGPLGDSDWAGSLSALYTTKDGVYFNNVTNQKLGLEENTAARVKLHYTGSDKLDVVFSLSYSDSSNDSLLLTPATTPNVPAGQQFTSDDVVPVFGPYIIATPAGPFGPSPITSPPTGETQQIIGSVNLSYDFGTVTLQSITAYVGLDDFFSTDFSGLGLLQGASDIFSDVFTQELQLRGTALDDRLNYLVGLYYFYEDAGQNFGWNIFGSDWSQSNMSIETKSIAVFAQADYQISDKLKARFGARWTEDDKTFGLDYQSLLLPPLTPARVDLHNTYSEVTPAFSLDYVLEPSGNVDSMLLYLSAARGYKSGGYSAIVISPADLAIARTPYFPETNWTYEAGIKTDLFGNKLRVNLAYYIADISDVTYNSNVADPDNPDGPGSFPVTNAGDVTIQGLEFELTWVASDNLSLFLSGATADGTFDRLDPTSAPAQAPILYGVEGQTPQTPDLAFSVGLDFSAQTSIGVLGFGLDYYWTDEYIIGATNSWKHTGWHRMNGYISLGFKENWQLRLSGRNLENEATAPTGGIGLINQVYLPPRQYMLSLNYRM